jgi:hypothetical protein
MLFTNKNVLTGRHNDIKRSSIHNISKNTNQLRTIVHKKERVLFALKEVTIPFYMPDYSTKLTIPINKKTRKKNIVENNFKIMNLPFGPLLTENTEIIIDSEPNSPKTYKYEFNEDEYHVTKEDVLLMVETKSRNMLDEYVKETVIQPIVEKYLAQIIHDDSRILLEEENDAVAEGAITKFEEMIEPAVARIVQRIIKYDYADNNNEKVEETASLNLEINYDEVYDYEMQEKGHFEAPRIIQQILQPGMYNPMYNTPIENIPPEDSSILDIGIIYKMTTEDNKKFYDNELRSEFKNSRKWLRFGNGIETGNVLDMVSDKLHRKIYIVGHFKHVNRIPIDNVAVYDMKERTWNQVGNGIPSVATCIALNEEEQIVFIGGVFTKVGKKETQIFAHNIAAYYILENKWIPLGEGLNRDCNTLVFDKKNKKLYAGGTFTQTGTQSMNYVGVYDLLSNTWNGLYGGETNGPCRIILKPNDTELYIGGLFTHVGISDIHASYVAKYNLETQTWSDLSGGLQGYCNALAYDASENVVYVGGTFNSVGNKNTTQNAHHIAKYDISNQTWDIMNGGVNNVVNSLSFDDVDHCLYVGGAFTHTYEESILLNRIGKYDPDSNKWSSLSNHFQNSKIPVEDEGNDNVGLNGVCRVMNMDDKSLFIAGSFQIAGSITANSIVRYVLNRGASV